MEENNNLKNENPVKETTPEKTATKSKKTTTHLKKSQNKSNKKPSDFAKMKKEVAERKKQKALDKKQKQAEKERIKAEKRVEIAKIKAQKKAEKERIKAEKQKEMKRKKQEISLKKAEAKKKAQERKATIKNESKSQREKRLAEERKEKINLKKQKADAKKLLKEEKLKNKQARKELKAKRKYLKAQKKQNGYGGWLAAVITLGITVMALGTLLALNYMMPTSMQSELDTSYQKSYYAFSDSVENLNLNLSKLSLSEGENQQQRLLTDIIVDSELAESNLSNLPLNEEDKFSLSKFINQVGDFSKTVNNKLINGEVLSEEEKQTIDIMQQITSELTGKLNELNDKVGNYNFTKLLNKKGDLISEKFGEMQNLSIEYPKLIYDGAFSDSKIGENLNIEGEEYSKSQAETVFKETFSYLGNIEITDTEKAQGKLDVYFVNGKADGKSVFAEISVKGGKLVLFSADSVCNNEKVSEELTQTVATEFIKNQNIDNMVAVWQQVTDNSVTYNFASIQNGVIVYNDLIKVKVCLGSGKVIGYEAVSYYSNHKTRNIDNPSVSQEDANLRVSSKIDIYSTRLALIPLTPQTERLAYEVVGDYNGDTYYIYIDAKTGDELEIFKVINSTDGSLIY